MKARADRVSPTCHSASGKGATVVVGSGSEGVGWIGKGGGGEFSI